MKKKAREECGRRKRGWGMRGRGVIEGLAYGVIKLKLISLCVGK